MPAAASSHAWPNGPRLLAAVCNGGANMSRQRIHSLFLASPKYTFPPLFRVVRSLTGCALAPLAYVVRHSGSPSKLRVLDCCTVRVHWLAFTIQLSKILAY